MVAAVGVLALQGAFREHIEAFARIGVEARAVKVPAQLDGLDALAIPGGESSAIGKLLRSSGLDEAISKKLATESLAILGTCAGMILSANEVLDGIADQLSFGIFEATVRRNGIGAQQASFETELDVLGLDTALPAVFIRPPVVESVGAEVEVLAEYGGKPVLCAQAGHVFATFHPELTGDDRVHQMFLARLEQGRG